MPRVSTVLLRGLRRRCPHCGRGRLFIGWYNLRPSCAQCGLDFDATSGNTWAFMYITTAFLTGLVILPMLLLAPPDAWTARLVVLPAALVLILGTLPVRKGIAIALEYLIDCRLSDRRVPSPGEPAPPQRSPTDG